MWKYITRWAFIWKMIANCQQEVPEKIFDSIHTHRLSAHWISNLYHVLSSWFLYSTDNHHHISNSAATEGLKQRWYLKLRKKKTITSLHMWENDVIMAASHCIFLDRYFLHVRNTTECKFPWQRTTHLHLQDGWLHMSLDSCIWFGPNKWKFPATNTP